MKFVLFTSLLALLLGSGLAQVRCPGAADPSCSAFASLEILVTGGECSGTASADCSAVSSSQSTFKQAFTEWWGEGSDACDGGKTEAAATAVATAIAEVWANAASKVSCNGRGFACGWSVANGNTFAKGFAEAMAQAAADALDTEQAAAFCFADIRAVSTVLAEAAAKAQSDVCVTDTGNQSDYQDSYVQAVKVAIAEAFAKATATACNRGTEVIAASECTGEGVSSTEEDVFAVGDACGGVSEIKACKGSGHEMCCSQGFRSRFCRCEGCDGPWTRVSKRGDLKKVFKDRSNNLCFCLDTADEGDDKEDSGDSTPAETSLDSGDTGSTNTPVEEESPSTDVNTTTESDAAEAVEESVEETEEVAVNGAQEAPAQGGEKAPRCVGAVDTSCNAFATLEILTTGGKCSGTAGASCEAVTESQNSFKKAFEEWWSEDGDACKPGKAEAAATAVATAIAEVWSEAAVKVTCEGHGFACGWSASGGESWANAFAEALAQAAAEAYDPHGQAEAFCFADIRAVTGVIATAAAASQSDACTVGGTKESFQESFALAVQVGIARAFAQATASACSIGGEVSADSECNGDATSKTESEVVQIGDACAGGKQLKQCDAGMNKCCSPSHKRMLCTCRTEACRGFWIRETDADASKNIKRSFSNRKTGDVCFCL